MSDVERSLGVSYPTVRAKLDDLISALTEREASGAPPAPPAPQVIATPPPQTEQEPSAAPFINRRDILAQISEGKLSVQEGMDMMKQLPGE
jgi:hypothetical protein